MNTSTVSSFDVATACEDHRRHVATLRWALIHVENGLSLPAGREEEEKVRELAVIFLEYIQSTAAELEEMAWDAHGRPERREAAA